MRRCTTHRHIQVCPVCVDLVPEIIVDPVWCKAHIKYSPRACLEGCDQTRDTCSEHICGWRFNYPTDKRCTNFKTGSLCDSCQLAYNSLMATHDPYGGESDYEDGGEEDE